MIDYLREMIERGMPRMIFAFQLMQVGGWIGVPFTNTGNIRSNELCVHVWSKEDIDHKFSFVHIEFKVP